MNKDQKLILQIVIGYPILLYMAYTYITHALGAFQAFPGFLTILTGIGFSVTLAKPLLIIVGVLDLLVVVALFAFRNKWTVAYAGLWPLVPAMLTYIGSGYFNWKYLHYVALMAVVYWVFIELGDKDSFFSFPKKTSKKE